MNLTHALRVPLHGHNSHFSLSSLSVPLSPLSLSTSSAVDGDPRSYVALQVRPYVAPYVAPFVGLSLIPYLAPICAPF